MFVLVIMERNVALIVKNFNLIKISFAEFFTLVPVAVQCTNCICCYNCILCTIQSIRIPRSSLHLKFGIKWSLRICMQIHFVCSWFGQHELRIHFLCFCQIMFCVASLILFVVVNEKKTSKTKLVMTYKTKINSNNFIMIIMIIMIMTMTMN